MIRYFLRALRTQLTTGRSLFLLTVLGVALGIASVLSIQIINRSALAAFRGSVQAVSGDADLSVLPRTPALADSLFPMVLADPGVVAAWPLYEVQVAVRGREQFFLDVVGVDFFAPLTLPWSGPASAVTDALAIPGWTAVTPSLARELGLRRGSRIEVSSGSRRVSLTVGALVDFQRLTPLASRRLAVMDLAQAQGLLGSRDELSQIDVRLVPGEAPAAAASRLRARLGSAVDVLTPEQREQRAEGLMRAFRLNISALSLISLVVGFFLVHSATQASLVRRRVEFGVLRAGGATRAQVLTLILLEVGLLGLFGVAVGLPLGYLAARANIHAVSATISNLYLLGEIERLDVPPWLWAMSAALGLLGTGLGALGPALDLSRTQVRDLLAAITLHERAGAAAPRLLGAAVVLLAATGIWFVLWGHAWQPAGFALAVALLLAVPLATPWLVQRLAGRLRIRRFGFAYSLRSLATRLQTTSFAASSLAIAVAMLVGITVMVASFRRTLTVWVTSTLRADVYVTTRSWRGAGPQGTLDSGLVAGIEAMPGVRYVDRLRGFLAWTGERRISLSGLDFGLPEGETRFPLLAGETASVLRAVRDSGAVIITEPLARKAGLWPGDSLEVSTPRGPRRLAIAGVSYDYSSENGGAAMDLSTFERFFGPGPINSLGLYLAPGLDPEAFVDRLRARFPGAPLNLRSNRGLREQVLKVFDETFAVTHLLQGMALLVAATGITLTLLVLARERAPELAVYRAIGARRRQIFRHFLGKGLGIGVFGLALGLAAGSVLAAILILVINRAYFGWTIQVHWPWDQLATAAATILAAAVVASLYPAARASRTPAAQLARDDL